jgi:hypothetical protein
MAEQTQTWWHNLGGWVTPQGWRNQLQFEPGVVVKYDRQWKLSPARSSGGWGIELIPHAGLSLGNVQTFAGAGAVARAGYNIPDDFGVQNIDSLATQIGGRTAGSFGAYLFAGVDGRVIGHSVFLDGNLWQQSHHVEKEILVGEWKFGGALAFRRFDMALTFLQRTREFKTQTHNDCLGSISLNLHF